MLFESVCILCLSFVIRINLIHCNCVLPNQIENGYWSVIDNETAITGQEIDSDDQISITCNIGYKVYPPSDVLTCQELLVNKPQCINTCATIKLKQTATVSCKFQGNDTQCDNPYHGTTAFLKCADYYENRNNDRKVFTCRYGKWNFDVKYDCEPVCGKKFVKAQEYIVNGQDVDLNEFTWHVAIYENKGFFEQICGGTIITPKISLSAAHCFKSPRKFELYFIGAGKTFRNYLDSRDVVAQYRNISNIVIPSYFSAAVDSRYDYDIAILILETSLEMNQFVLPACLDKLNLLKDLTATKGIVTGWGHTEVSNSPSDRLKKLDVDYKNEESCTLRYDFKKYYFPHVRDKICAGIYRQGKSACKGDSGGGLVFIGEDERYYIKGIVSIGPQKKGSCDSSQLTLYTSVAFHADFIQKQMDQYNELNVIKTINKITSYKNGCIFPKLENGRLEIVADSYDSDYILKPGFPCPENVTLLIKCYNGFKSFPDNVKNITCHSQWSNVVECRRFCPTLTASGVNVTCDYNGQNVNCIQPYHNTVASVSCLPLYNLTEVNYHPYRYCEDGFWSDAVLPKCVTTCGLNFIDGQKIMEENTTTSIEELPWYVSIYSLQTYLCSGVLVGRFKPNLKQVLTSNCVDGHPARYLTVVSGKSGIHNQISGQDEDIQQVNVVKVVRNLIQANSFFLILEDKLKLSKTTQPVCWKERYASCINQEGFLTGWEYAKPANESISKLVKIKVIGREYNLCGPDDGGYYYSHNNNNYDNKICVEVIGKPNCNRITGATIVFQKGKQGPYYIYGVVNIKYEYVECNQKYFKAELPDVDPRLSWAKTLL